ncbi:MAG: HlyD family efflux transporter periplasmic adaptor subunit [Rhizobiaceae bacterium]
MFYFKAGLFTLCVLGFLAYCSWMIGPYLSSVLVRDAAITVWLETSIAPIDGKVTGGLPRVGATIGANQKVAEIKNDLLLDANQTVEALRDKVISARLNRDEARQFLKKLEELEVERQVHQQHNIEIYLAQIDTTILNLEREVEINNQRLGVLQRIVERQKRLLDRRSGSQAKLDDAIVPVGEVLLRQAELEAGLRIANLRRDAAENNIFVQEDGEIPNWVRRNELLLSLELQRAHRDLHNLESGFRESLNDLMESQRILDKLSDAKVTAPARSTVFRVLVSPHATVAAGDRIIEWGNCSQLLVDVPVSDVELPFIKPGSDAQVYLDGEDFQRNAKVLLTRGASATLGTDQLVATAKGRAEGVGQVLLTLEHNGSRFEECPVGRPAHVDFPGVGILDVLRARLRF